MAAHIVSLTLLAFLLRGSLVDVVPGVLARVGGDLKQKPVGAWLCEGETAAEDDCEENGKFFVTPPALIVAALPNLGCVSDDDAGITDSLHRFASPRAPPVVSS